MDELEPVSDVSVSESVESQSTNAVASGSETGEASPPSGAGDGGAVASVADPRAEIDSLAAQYGLEPSQLAGFADASSAREAVRLWADATAKQGLGGVQQQPQYEPQPPPYQPPYPPQYEPPAPPAAPVATSIDLKALGLDDDDPAAKAIRALEQQFATLKDSTESVASRLQQQEDHRAEQNRQALHASAEDVVTRFQSAKYGVAGNRTSGQQLAVARLYDLADAILIGAYNAGRPAPSLQARLAQARLIDDSESSVARPTVPAVAPRPVSPAATPSANGLSLTERWSANPAIRAALGL